MPRVSVIMPVYNGHAYIDEAIQSILGQTMEDFELIIIDDGSTQPVWEKIKSYADPRIRAYQHEKNQGFTATLNHCLDLVEGDFIARMDDDDISHPQRLEKQLKGFEHPAIGFVGCWARSIDIKGTPIVHYVETDCRCTTDDLRNVYPIKHCMADPTIMYLRYAAKMIGYYDREVFNATDYNYARRIQRFMHGRMVEEILYTRRVGSSTVPRRNDIDVIELANRRAEECPIIREKI